jgi:hypothetical protein
MNRMLRGMLALEGRAALRSGLPFGLTVFAVARKPSLPTAADAA